MSFANFNKLESFHGCLTIGQAAAGIEAAIVNARSLLDDAQLLLETDRWARAASLSVLAIEEAGKVPLLRSLLVLPESEVKKAWRDYRSHTKKNVLAGFGKFRKDSPKIDDFLGLFAKSNDYPQMLDAVKQLGFYSDCLGKCNWSLPSQVVTEELAKLFVSTAEILVPRGDSAMQSAPELKIWVKYMRPARGQEMLIQKRALIACYQEASDLGVLRGERTVGDFAKFLL